MYQVSELFKQYSSMSDRMINVKININLGGFFYGKTNSGYAGFLKLLNMRLKMKLRL